MNKTPAETRAIIDELKPLVHKAKWCDIVLCVPYIDIAVAVKALKDSRVNVGAQNLHQAASGAYTGEISGAMLKESGVRYVIIGHSERREYFGENDELVNMKVKAALAAGLRPIICVGESLKQREMDVTLDLIAYQIRMALADIPVTAIRRVVFAYEPIWAIGTGKTATAEQAGEVGTHIRSVIRKQYGARASRSVSILYGGSMNPENAAELLAQPDVDGGLIGGASLKAQDLAVIVNAANQ
jgi:triosephosphate isomerase